MLRALLVAGMLAIPVYAQADVLDGFIECTRSSDCTNFSDLYQDDADFRMAIDVLKGKSPEEFADWVAGGLTMAESIRLGSDGTLSVFSICEPRVCGDDHYVFAYNKTKKVIAGMRFPGKGKAPIIIGEPSESIRAIILAFDAKPLPATSSATTPPPADAVIEDGRKKLIKEVLDRCAATYADTSPSVVKVCIENDARALKEMGEMMDGSAGKYDGIFASCMDRYKRSGYSVVKTCMENDLEAAAEISVINDMVNKWK